MANADSYIGYQTGAIPSGGSPLDSVIGHKVGAIPSGGGASIDSHIGFVTHRLSAPTHVTPRAWTPVGWVDAQIAMWTGTGWEVLPS